MWTVGTTTPLATTFVTGGKTDALMLYAYVETIWLRGEVGRLLGDSV